MHTKENWWPDTVTEVHSGHYVWGMHTINTKTSEGLGKAMRLLLWNTGCVPEPQNKVGGRYILYASPTFFIGHCEGGSYMFFFDEMCGAKWEPCNMNWIPSTLLDIQRHISQTLKFTCITRFKLEWLHKEWNKLKSEKRCLRVGILVKRHKTFL